jgi:hypothetical protein
MSRRIRIALRCTTAAGWLVLVLAATPWGGVLTEPEMRLGLAVAAVGTVAVILRKSQAPADELYRVGKSVGRAEILAEIASGNVTRMPSERPALRVVGDERDQA